MMQTHVDFLEVSFCKSSLSSQLFPNKVLPHLSFVQLAFELKRRDRTFDIWAVSFFVVVVILLLASASFYSVETGYLIFNPWFISS